MSECLDDSILVVHDPPESDKELTSGAFITRVVCSECLNRGTSQCALLGQQVIVALAHELVVASIRQRTDERFECVGPLNVLREPLVAMAASEG